MRSYEIKVQLLELDGKLQRPSLAPLGVIPGASHSGKDKGIMRSVLSAKSKNKPQVREILKCLTVNTENDYTNRAKELEALTKATQKGKHRYAMLVFIIKDDQGNPVKDYDLFLLGGDSQNPDKLTKGFFVDRQKNTTHPNHLVYYIDYDLVTKNKLTGFRIIARPADGFVFYHVAEYHTNGLDINNFLKPNETFYVEIKLHRCVDKNVFRLDNASNPKLRKEGLILKSETRHSFKNEKPLKKEIDKS